MIILDEQRQNPNPNLLKVFLSSDDCIVDTTAVRRYLEAHGVEYCVGKKHVHGSFIVKSMGWHKVCEWIDSITKGELRVSSAMVSG